MVIQIRVRFGCPNYGSSVTHSEAGTLRLDGTLRVQEFRDLGLGFRVFSQRVHIHYYYGIR